MKNSTPLSRPLRSHSEVASQKQNALHILLFSSFISILLSINGYWRSIVINPDAICYVLTAEGMARWGWHAILNTCPQAHWGFYSILIFSISHLFSLSSIMAAYCLDGCLSLMSVVTFIFLVRELGGKSTRLMLFAALTILLSHEFNSVRQYIIRDHGFWAGLLLSILFLLRYINQPTLIKLVGFHLSLILATLFRIEGAIFLLTIPFTIWIIPQFSYRERAYHFFKFYAPLLLMAAMLLSYFMLQPTHTLRLGRFAEIIYQLKHGVIFTINHFNMIKKQLAQYVLVPESKREAGVFLGAALIIWYLLYVAMTISWGYVLLLFYGAFKGPYNYPKAAIRILAMYAILSIFITFIYFSQHLFLSKRYLVALTLICMLFVPFSFDALLSEWRKRNKRFFLLFCSTLILSAAVSGVVEFGHSKQYLREAGDWLDKYVKKNERLYVNDFQLMYHSQHFDLNIFNQLTLYRSMNILQKKNWQQFDYIALARGHDENLTVKQQPIKVFMNKRGDSVAIYKRGSI